MSREKQYSQKKDPQATHWLPYIVRTSSPFIMWASNSSPFVRRFINGASRLSLLPSLSAYSTSR